jgi:hypothetical protein
VFTTAAGDLAAACLLPGAGGDPAAELRRQSVLVDDLVHRLTAVLRVLPDERTFDDWWGPAREALQRSVDIERARLGREVWRLEGVRGQLDAAASQLPGGGAP